MVKTDRELFVEEIYDVVKKYEKLGLDICGILEIIKLDIWSGTIDNIKKTKKKWKIKEGWWRNVKSVER